MKTKFWILVENNRGLISLIVEKTTLHRDTISKARDTDKLNFDTKLQIYNALLELNIIKQDKIFINDLFSEEVEVWEDNKETSMNLQEVI